MATLEGHYADMCDIEFTIEERRLWILQTRVGKRTAFGEWVMARDMLDEGLIDESAALQRVDANRLEELFKRRVKADGATPIAKGLNASPGAATGQVVFSADDAEARANDGTKVILVRRETTPDDYHGMIAAQGILTSAGGTNSHAAVVARGEGIPAVCGADTIKLDLASRVFNANGTTVGEGDVITIDGFTGNVFVGELPLEESVLEKARAGDAGAREQPIWMAFERLMAIADDRRRMRVRANADTPDQSTNARDRGAEGIGLCRTEHMFLGEERVDAVRQMIFAETEAEEQAAYERLLPLQKNDFVGIFRAMDGLPVTVRLLDPPLHEFLPDMTELSVEVALAEERGEHGDALDRKRMELKKVRELHEANPMLGLRGVRLGIVKPGLYAMQVRAIVEAAVEVRRAGGDPKVEIMIPLVATKPELEQMRAELEPVAREILDREGVELSHLEWGTMIELPRAAVTAGEIAETADFFSFGTNDLTQTAFGFSRDDIGKFVAMYEERKLVPANPFVTIDRPGVGRLMEIACADGRVGNPSIHLGICGEHGGDPASVIFCHELGLDYVSCSPFRVETARLAAGQAAAGSRDPPRRRSVPWASSIRGTSPGSTGSASAEPVRTRPAPRAAFAPDREDEIRMARTRWLERNGSIASFTCGVGALAPDPDPDPDPWGERDLEPVPVTVAVTATEFVYLREGIEELEDELHRRGRAVPPRGVRRHAARRRRRTARRGAGGRGLRAGRDLRADRALANARRRARRRRVRVPVAVGGGRGRRAVPAVRHRCVFVTSVTARASRPSYPRRSSHLPRAVQEVVRCRRVSAARLRACGRSSRSRWWPVRSRSPAARRSRRTSATGRTITRTTACRRGLAATPRWSARSASRAAIERTTPARSGRTRTTATRRGMSTTTRTSPGTSATTSATTSRSRTRTTRPTT